MAKWDKLRQEIYNILYINGQYTTAYNLQNMLKTQFAKDLIERFIKTGDDSEIDKLITNEAIQDQDDALIMIKHTRTHPTTGEELTPSDSLFYLDHASVSFDSDLIATPKPQPKPKKKIELPVVSKDQLPNYEVHIDVIPLIPKPKEEYIPRIINKDSGLTDIDILTKAYSHKLNVLITGPPGAGKTHCVRELAVQLKLPYIRLECHGGIEISELIGQWIPDKDHAGRFKWVDGLLTLIVRHGGVFCCDEVNAMPREFSFKLHGLLDDERRLVLTEHDPPEIIPAHPNFFFVATMNPGAEGTRELNEAFADRFDIVMNFDYDDRIESEIINNSSIRAFAKKIRKKVVRGIDTTVSTRMLKQFERNIGILDKQTAMQLFMNKFEVDEKKTVREVLELELSKKDEPKRSE